MAFKKGNSGNPTGRPAGSSNKAACDLRQWINNFIEGNREQIEKDWQALEPKDRLIMFERLLKYSLPTLQAKNLNAEVNTDRSAVILTKEQIKEIHDALEAEY